MEEQLNKELENKAKELELKERQEAQRIEREELNRRNEEQRWEAEMALRREELQRANQRAQEQLDRDAALKEEADQKERERARNEERKEAQKREEYQKKSERLRRASKRLEKILPKMGEDGAEIPMYFKTIENYFQEFEIEGDLKIALILPSMNAKARKVINRLDIAQREDYEEVKKQILREFKMTPRAYRQQFTEAVKASSESWMQYASKLETILTYYIDGRNVSTIEELKNLIIADRMKDTMQFKLKEYILSKEGEAWLVPKELAEAADVYISNVGENTNFNKNGYGVKQNFIPPTKTTGPEKPMEGKIQPRERTEYFQKPKPNKIEWKSSPPYANKTGFKCFKCGGPHAI